MKKFKLLYALGALTLTVCSCSTPVPTDTDSPAPESSALTADSVPYDETEEREDIELVYAVAETVSPDDQKVIDLFNAADNGYTVRTEIYGAVEYNEHGLPTGQSEEDIMAIDFQLLQDTLNSDKIDIFSYHSFHNYAQLEILEQKGAFADLNPFLENDSSINRDTLNEHVLSLSEHNGKLFHLPVSFTANTLMGPMELVGTKENWTVDEFIERYDSLPSDKTYTFNGNINSEYIYMAVLRGNLENYIDYNTASVHFDCPEFRRIMEFCYRFPNAGRQKGEFYGNDNDYVFERLIMGFMEGGQYFTDEHPLTMVGFPTDNGSGAFLSTYNYAVSAKSSPEKQKGAWEFIKTFADEEIQAENYITIDTINYMGKKHIQYGSETGFPINNKAFERVMKSAAAGEYANKTDIFTGEEREDVYIPTTEECQRLAAYLNRINRLEPPLDRSLFNITQEEASAYFYGENDLDRCIDLIQNRSAIWISEHS